MNGREYRRLAHSARAASRIRALPLACGASAFVLVLAVWGSLRPVATGNDESAYLLQARIFASGHVVAPSPPLPEFFQQYHVFVKPVLAAKYPPGHSLLLTAGVWLGTPGLVPALLVGLSAAILCTLTRRLTDSATAALAVVLATTSDIALRFDASYFSEITTAALFVIGWGALFEYWQSGRRRWLVLYAASVAWGAITRPVTMLAYAAPSAICAVLAVRRHRSWRDILPALVAGVALFSILPLWNAQVVGDWRTLPQSVYAREYMPSDRLGFGASPEAPAAQLTSEEEKAADVVRRLHAAYTPAAVPSAAGARATNVIRGTWSYGGIPGLAILAAVAFLPVGISRLLIGTILCVFVAYLTYAQDPEWTLYYLELEAPLAFLTAVGIYASSNWLSGAMARRWPRQSLNRRTLQRSVFALAAACLVAPGLARIAPYRRAHQAQRTYRDRFERLVAGLPAHPSIVFVQYAPGHGEERLVENVPDLSAARTWIVHDRGAEDARLLAAAPGRLAYLYREIRQGDSISVSMEPLPASEPRGNAERPSIHPQD